MRLDKFLKISLIFKTRSSGEKIIEEGNVLINEKPIQQMVKRIIDIALSLITIIVLSPLFVLLIILISKESKGAALFKQERVGLNGKSFYMYKFRSMVEDTKEKKNTPKNSLNK